MKHLFTVLLVAFAFIAYAPQADAGCGKCGNEAKSHTHEPGHNHEHEAAECTACGKDKADCACEGTKEAALCAACGESKADCTCKKG